MIKACQIIRAVGYILAAIVIAPFMILIVPIALIIWAWDKIVECAEKEDDL